MLTTEQIITFCIALYGAILSTILGIHELRKNKPKIEISIAAGTLIDNDMKQSEPMIVITAVNKGLTKVVLTGCGWTRSDKHKNHITHPYLLTFPIIVEPHRKAETYFGCRRFRELLGKEKINGLYFQDEEGNTWTKKVSKKERDSWENASSSGYLIEYDPKLHIYYRKNAS